VSATFLINVAVFLVVLYQTASDGFLALMEPPGTHVSMDEPLSI